MIRVIITAILLTTYWTSYSQKISVTYHDTAWRLTTKQFATFFRVGIIDTIKYKIYGEVKDHFMNGRLQMKGVYSANIKIDTFYFYFPSGKLMTKGPYSRNIRYGIWTNYYENGNVKDKIFFHDVFIATIEHNDENGNPKIIGGTGDWEIEYSDDSMKDALTRIKGAYKDTLRHGTWNYYEKCLIKEIDCKERLVCTEVYDNGKFINGKYYWGGGGIENLNSPVFKILPESIKFKNADNWVLSKYASREAYPYLKFLPNVDSTVFPLDKKAEFPGGLDSLTKIFAKNMKLSKSYIASQKGRSAMFNIMIDESGILKITQDPNKASFISFPDNQVFYERVLKTIKKLPTWEPAKRNGKNVKNHFMIMVHMDNGNIGVQLLSMN